MLPETSGTATGEALRHVEGDSIQSAAVAPEFSPPERRFMLELARAALANAVIQADNSPLPLAQVPLGLVEAKACFVTLTKHGSLRGCVGNLMPHASLYQTIIENVRRAALSDPRFPPVQANELPELKIEISLLNEARPLRYASPEQLLALLHPNQDGVLLRIGARLAMFLPQVWQQIPDKEQFLARLAQKAGCPPAAWRAEDASVSVYSVESFGEN